MAQGLSSMNINFLNSNFQRAREYYVVVRDPISFTPEQESSGIDQTCQGIFNCYDVAQNHCKTGMRIEGPFQVTYFPDPLLDKPQNDVLKVQPLPLSEPSSIYSFKGSGFFPGERHHNPQI